MGSHITLRVQQIAPQNEAHGNEPVNRWGLRIAFGFVIALAVIALLVAQDARRTTDLEQFVETTAVGDRKVVDLAALSAGEGQPRIQMNGNPVQVVIAPRIDLRDSRMRRVEKDAASGISIYTTDPVNLKGQRLKGSGEAGSIFFLKVTVNEYVQCLYTK